MSILKAPIVTAMVQTGLPVLEGQGGLRFTSVPLFDKEKMRARIPGLDVNLRRSD
jgi:hypothetical protein